MTYPPLEPEVSEWPPASCPIQQKVNSLLDMPYLMGTLLIGVAVGAVISIASGYYATFCTITLLSNRV